MFLLFKGKLVNSDTVNWIDFHNLVDENYVRIHYKNGQMEVVDGMNAFHLVNELAPQALEGRNAKYVRHAWAIHNLLGHPLMQIFSWLGLPQLGIKIHDITTPFPIIK